LSPRAESGDNYGQIVPLIDLSAGAPPGQYVEKDTGAGPLPHLDGSSPLRF
jgi:hypothetical protein